MTGWWQHNEVRDFPLADRYGHYIARDQAEAGGTPIPRNFLVDAFFVCSVTSGSSGGSRVPEDERPVQLDTVNARPKGLVLVRIVRNLTNTGVLLTVSPHTDFQDREDNDLPRQYYEFEVLDTAQRWDKVMALEMFSDGGDPGEEGLPYLGGGYGILVIGTGPADVPVGAVAVSSLDAPNQSVHFESDCILYTPVLLGGQVNLAMKVPSRHDLDPGAVDLDGSEEPITSELRAVLVTARGTPSYVGSLNPLATGYNSRVTTKKGSVLVEGAEGAGLGHQCDGLSRVPGSEVVPVSCSGLVKSLAGSVPEDRDLKILGENGLSVETEPGRVTLALDGEEVTGGSV